MGGGMARSKAPPVFFESPAPSFATAERAPGRRAFEGVAYSGDAISDGWTPVVIDSASIRLSTPCPVLLEHDREARVGA
jgi:hypothetical protein